MPQARLTGRSCIVVGAGPAGLAAAWWLQRNGVRTEVLEAASTLGGRTQSMRIEGSTLNRGAAFFTSFYDETLALCRELRLPLAVPRVHPTRAGAQRMMSIDGRLVPYAPGKLANFARFSHVPVRQRVRLLRELVRLVRGPALHIAAPASLAACDTESVSRWAIQRLGQEAYDYFVRPAIEPFFYMRAEDVSAAVARALLRHATRWSIVTPRGGMGAFCAALGAPVSVQLDCRVRAVRADERSVEVEHVRGISRAEAVLLAVPAPDLLAIDGGVSDRVASQVVGARYEPCVMAVLGYRGRIMLPAASITVGGPGAHALVGVTALARSTPPGFIRAGDEVVSVLAMGWRSRGLLGCDDATIVRELMEEARCLGVGLPDPCWHTVVAHKAATVVPEPGFTRRLQRLACTRRERIRLAGDWVAGVSTVEGAVRSGLAAARAIAAARWSSGP